MTRKIYIVDDSHVFKANYKDIKEHAQEIADMYGEDAPKNKKEVWEYLDDFNLRLATKSDVAEALEYGEIDNWE